MIFKILAIGFVWKGHLGQVLGQGVRKRVWVQCMLWFTAATNPCTSYLHVHYMYPLYLRCITSVPYVLLAYAFATFHPIVKGLQCDTNAIVMKEQHVHFHNSWASLVLRWAAQVQPHVSCVTRIVQVLLESNNPGVVVCPCCLLLGRVIRIYGFAWWIRGYKHTVG